MKAKDMLRPLALSLLVSASLPALTGCREQATLEDVSLETSIDELGAISEIHGTSTIAMLVMPDGKVTGLVRQNGATVKSNVTGEVTARPLNSEGKPVVAKLEQDQETGLLKGEIPGLNDELTELNYKLVAENGPPIQGILHLPKGGTPELVDSAKRAAEVKTVTPELKGPNGGIVQVVGDDTVEVVANKKSNEVRVYVLDADLKPVVVGKRQVRLAYTSDQGSEVVTLVPHTDQTYFTGPLRLATSPSRVTVIVHDDEHVHVARCHYHPHKAAVVDHHAPGVNFFVVANWGPAVIVDHGHPARVNVKVGAPVVHVYHHDYHCDCKHCKKKHHKHGKGKKHK